MYTMYDTSGDVIYVGKAVKLRNRVSSYFRNIPHEPKVERMIEHVDRFSVILCENELDALITECSLIKLHNPFYNIKLKDGHGYPFICVSLVDGCPRVKTEYSRPAGARCFGPFAYLQNVSLIVGLLNSAYKLPSCNYKPRTKPCLEYDMGRCNGFCAGKGNGEEMKKAYDSICAVLEGKTDAIEAELTADMEKAAARLDFEEAALLRDRRKALGMISKKQRPVISQNRHADYVGFRTGEDRCCIFLLRLRNGYVVGERCDVFEEPFTPDLLRQYLERFYTEDTLPPGKIYLPQEYEWTPLLNQWLKGKITVPVYEQDVRLRALADRNAGERMLQYEGKTARLQRQLDAFSAFSGLRKVGLMEVYDISQTAGADVVCGSITVRDGICDRKKYKKYRIRQTLGRGDTDYMKEAVQRRIIRYKEGDEGFAPLPDVILCDGGLAQIHAVEEVLKEEGISLPILGLKKDSRHRTKSLVFSDGTEKLLATNPEVFSFCGRLQEEVHRVAISYHKNLRQKAMQQSQLEQIPGVGKAKAKALFLHFKSIDKIRKATKDELCAVKGVNPALAEKIIQWFSEN
ncbi:MAG: excinuclease ABC subunit C [Clostridia bacterium]|nr:excinuclease ABC subunit C [Clostridia bacterium]